MKFPRATVEKPRRYRITNTHIQGQFKMEETEKKSRGED
jgi:hypothetical protein